jgi:hypothetical protein
MIELSLSDLERWLKDLLAGVPAQGGFQSEVLTLQDLVDAYRARTRNVTNTTAVGKALKRFGVNTARRVVTPRGRLRLFALWRPATWSGQQSTAWIQEYAKQP